MAAPKKTENQEEITILPIKQGLVTIAFIGQTPLLYNTVNQKAQRELLMPRGRLSKADKASNLKHDPLVEYRGSVTRRREGDHGQTRLVMKSETFKAAIAHAALDMPGSASKAQIGRLTWVEGLSVDIFGVPQIHAGIVRMADIGRTPDIRFRACLPRWCGVVSIRYMTPMLTGNGVCALFAAAGMICGIGDFRQQKGKGSYGQFRMCDIDDPEFLEIKREGGTEAQDAALENPVCFDAETEELLMWFNTERSRRGRDDHEVAEKVVKPKKSTHAAEGHA